MKTQMAIKHPLPPQPQTQSTATVSGLGDDNGRSIRDTILRLQMKMRKITKTSVNNKYFASVENVNFGWSGQTSTHEWWWQTTTDSSQSEQRPQQRITLRLWVFLGSLVMGNWLITTATFPQPATVISINHSDLINIVWSIIVHCILYFEFLITVNLYRVLPMIFSPLNTGINLLHWSLGAGTLLLLIQSLMSRRTACRQTAMKFSIFLTWRWLYRCTRVYRCSHHHPMHPCSIFYR